MKEKFMELCVERAKYGVQTNQGGPFGALIVKNNIIVGIGNNTVIKDNDPTAHGEINAIRDACKTLQTFDLSECELYTSAEPCPMCLSAIMWSNIKKVYYGCSVEDTDNIGFRDGFIYNWLQTHDIETLELEQVSRDRCLEAFKVWTDKQDKEQY